MSTPVCIFNNILVELPKAFQDELVASGGTIFYQDTTFRPEWNTTIKGIVASVPKRLIIGGETLDPDRPKIRQIVKPGDEIIFSYLVVMNRKQTDNVGEIFERQTPKNPYTTVWTNPNGLEFVRMYLLNDKYEIGLFDTKSKTWVDRVKGGEREVESFMGKYMPTENVGFNYGNLLPYDGKDYWKVDYPNAIAIKRAEGIFDMIGEYSLVEPISEPKDRVISEDLFVYNAEQSTDYKAVGKLLSIGDPLKGQPTLSVKPNDTIVIDARYLMKYEIDGKDYWVVRQKHIMGKSIINEHIGDS